MTALTRSFYPSCDDAKTVPAWAGRAIPPCRLWKLNLPRDKSRGF